MAPQYPNLLQLKAYTLFLKRLVVISCFFPECKGEVGLIKDGFLDTMSQTSWEESWASSVTKKKSGWQKRLFPVTFVKLSPRNVSYVKPSIYELLTSPTLNKLSKHFAAVKGTVNRFIYLLLYLTCSLLMHLLTYSNTYFFSLAHLLFCSFTSLLTSLLIILLTCSLNFLFTYTFCGSLI